MTSSNTTETSGPENTGDCETQLTSPVAERIRSRWYAEGLRDGVKKGMYRAAQIAHAEGMNYVLTQSGDGQMACEVVAMKIKKEARSGQDVSQQG